MIIKNIAPFLIYILILVAGCSVGSNSNSSTQDGTIGSANIQMSNVTTIPTANYTSGEYTLVTITNNSDSNITLHNTRISANNQTLPASAISSYIDLNSCLQISKHTSCTAKILTNPTFQSYLLSLTYIDSTGKNYTLTQLISFNALLPVQNGFIYDATQLSINNSGLAIPFRLAANYSNISVLINDKPATFSCYGNNYKLNTLCSANISTNNMPASSTESNSIKIIGYGSNSKPIMNTILTLTNTQTGNIITSGQNVVINPDDGTSPQTVYLVNNGLAATTGITITPKTPITISSNTCTAILNAGANCSFVINVTGLPISGQGSVAISYSNSQTTQLLYFNVSYINPGSSAGLTLTQSGTFNNIITNSSPAYVSLNISNTGNNTLTNLHFNNLSLQNNKMSSIATFSSCFNGINLSSGQSCFMVLGYTPTAVESGTVNFIPTASYLGQGGESRTYTNSILNLAYSAVSTANFVASGDYGMVISSTTTPATWVANVDNPFPTAATAANGIIQYTNFLSMTLSNGSGKYDDVSGFGLFWKSSSATNLSASTCNIVQQGSTFYTCGTTSAATGSCATGRSCIISAPSITGPWTGIFQPTQNVPFYNIFAVPSLPSPTMVVATLANTTAGGGIVTGNSSTPFSQPATAGTAANSSLMALAYNSNANTMTAWASTGTSTTAIAAIGSTWAATTTRPAISPVRGAGFDSNNGGSYVVATAAGNIYRTTSPTTAYTTEYTGTTQLNDVFTNPTVVVGNNGLVLESSTQIIGPWLQFSIVIGESTTPNLTRISPTNAGFSITGVSTLMYGIYEIATNNYNSFKVPAITSLAKAGNTYLAMDNREFLQGPGGGSALYTSTDLINWTINFNFFYIGSVVYCTSATLCFTVGSQQINKSTDGGLNWSIAFQMSNMRFKAINCQFNICVAVGNNSGGFSPPTNGVVASTNNYTTWAMQTQSLPTLGLNAVTSYNNLFITVGESGTIFYSSNGSNWTSVTSPTTKRLNGVACGITGAGCVAVGESGTIIFSPTGTGNWAVQTSGTTNGLNAVAYSGQFVAVGNASTIKISTNGTTWTNGAFPATSSDANNLWVVISK